MTFFVINDFFRLLNDFWIVIARPSGRSNPCQSLQQFGVNPAKAAIAHAQHMVAGSGSSRDLRHQAVDVASGMRPFAHG